LVWARLLRQGQCDQQEQEEGFAVIERSAEAQTQLLDDLLDVSRIASGKTRLTVEETDLVAVVRQAIEGILPTAKAKGVEINTSFAQDIRPIEADPDRLRQVVGNLLNNAVKFTPTGGRIETTLSQSDSWVELTVSDTGKGIEPDFLPRVFTAFSQADASTTRSFGGLGLGLAICKELVELHGGTIHAESVGPDKGATFTVRLPLAGTGHSGRGASRKEVSEPLAADGIDGARVLLVEDENETREVLSKLLSKNGAQVLAVDTAAKAMQEFEKSRPDLIVSDIGLPGVDGYHMLQQIRSLEMERGEPPTPAIALTAFAGRKDRRMARESGFHKHIAKPVSPAVLLAAISTLLADKNRALGGD
jgi:CheY-like chemotaxis protein